MRKALIIVDVQRDFMLNGALAVEGAGEILHPITRLASEADMVIATRDWHTINHSSFKINGGPWPTHCVQGTPGARLNPLIDQLADVVISKGTRVDEEGYSGFENGVLSHILFDMFTKKDEIYITGLATDYCVKATALDAAYRGFNVIVPREAVKAVNSIDGVKALDLMVQSGVKVI